MEFIVDYDADELRAQLWGQGEKIANLLDDEELGMIYDACRDENGQNPVDLTNFNDVLAYEDDFIELILGVSIEEILDRD